MSGAMGGRGAAGPQGPAGPVGPQGPQGDPGLVDITMEPVTTLEPDQPATAELTEPQPGMFRLKLSIPRGRDGDADVELEVGEVVTLDADEPAYVRFVGKPPVGLEIQVGTVTALPPGSKATVTIEKE